MFMHEPRDLTSHPAEDIPMHYDHTTSNGLQVHKSLIVKQLAARQISALFTGDFEALGITGALIVGRSIVTAAFNRRHNGKELGASFQIDIAELRGTKVHNHLRAAIRTITFQMVWPE